MSFWDSNGAANQDPISVTVNVQVLNIQTKGPYWRILARGRDGTNRAQLGMHKSYVGQNYFPPYIQTSKVSK